MRIAAWRDAYPVVMERVAKPLTDGEFAELDALFEAWKAAPPNSPERDAAYAAWIDAAARQVGQ